MTETYHKAGDPCPKCGHPMEERAGMFALREVGSMPGIVCCACNSLWNSREFVEALRARAGLPPLGPEPVDVTARTRALTLEDS